MQLTQLCNKHNIRIVSEYGGVPNNPDFGPGSHSYKTILHRRNPKRQITTPFHMGPAHCEGPTAADVLYCLISDTTSVDNARSFEDWCAEFGYDTDSRKAEKIYKQCLAIGEKLHRFLADDFDNFAQAEH